jgi:hypothetical protein
MKKASSGTLPYKFYYFVPGLEEAEGEAEGDVDDIPGEADGDVDGDVDGEVDALGAIDGDVLALGAVLDVPPSESPAPLPQALSDKAVTAAMDSVSSIFFMVILPYLVDCT